MPNELIDSVLELISSLVRYELGSTQFYTVLALSAVAWLLVARLFMGLLQSDRGFIAAFFALVLPLFSGLLAYGLVDGQIVPAIEADWADQFLAPGALVLVTLAMVLVVAKHIIQLSGLTTLIIYLFASAAALGCFYGASVALETLEKGSEQIKQREERTQKEIDSVL